MSNLSMILLIILMVFLVITVGCGFAIHYGGDAFKDAIKGHLILGVLTLLFTVFLLISVLINK